MNINNTLLVIPAKTGIQRFQQPTGYRIGMPPWVQVRYDGAELMGQ